MMLSVSNDKMPNANVVSKSVNRLKIDANNPITIASNIPMINAAIKNGNVLKLSANGSLTNVITTGNRKSVIKSD